MHLVNLLDHGWGHGFASKNRSQLGLPFRGSWPRRDEVLSELLDLIVGWSGEKIVFLPLFFLQHFRACFNHVVWACADVIITL